MKPVGKPDAGNPHVRFDERGGETDRSRDTAPLLDSTSSQIKAVLILGVLPGAGGTLGWSGLRGDGRFYLGGPEDQSTRESDCLSAVFGESRHALGYSIWRTPRRSICGLVVPGECPMKPPLAGVWAQKFLTRSLPDQPASASSSKLAASCSLVHMAERRAPSAGALTMLICPFSCMSRASPNRALVLRGGGAGDAHVLEDAQSPRPPGGRMAI